MRTFLLTCFVALQAAMCLARDDENKTPYLTKSLANDAVSSVIVSTSGGGIEVSGQSGQQPRIEVYIRGNNNKELSKQEIKKRLDEDYEMIISVNDHELSAVVKTKHEFENWKHQMSISFKIFVPEQVATDLQTRGGGISLDHLKGDEKFSTRGGGLSVDELNGTIVGNTSGGGIEVTNSGDNIDLQTRGGGIVAKHCHGTIKLETSGGGLDLSDLKGDIKADTRGGGVTADNIAGELVTSTSGGGIDLRNMDCSLEASTKAGSLYAQMKKVGKYLKLETRAGNIDLELPLKQGLDLDMKGESVNQHTKEVSDFDGAWDKDHIKGTVNGGGIPVNVYGGNIEVKFK